METPAAYTSQPPDRMLKWFAIEGPRQPEPRYVAADYFNEMAHRLCTLIDPGPERTVALRKLLEAKDATVRATLYPGG